MKSNEIGSNDKQHDQTSTNLWKIIRNCMQHDMYKLCSMGIQVAVCSRYSIGAHHKPDCSGMHQLLCIKDG